MDDPTQQILLHNPFCTNSGHHALRYELTTMKSSTRGRRSLRDIRRKRSKPSQRSQRSQVENGGPENGHESEVNR